MLLLVWLVLCLAGAALIALPVALTLRGIFLRNSGSRLVECPENHQAAVVNIDARHAAATAIDGTPDVRLCQCTRWPERAKCNRACLPQALNAVPYREGKAGAKPIYHLPVLLAAFVVWCLGAVWHSQYLFRAEWLQASGITHVQIKQLVWWYSPHLLTAAICLLFAYGVAWLLALGHRKGILQGIIMSVLLCGALAAASGYAIARLPHDFLTLEAGFLGIAAITVGAIIGGLENKFVLWSR